MIRVGVGRAAVKSHKAPLNMFSRIVRTAERVTTYLKGFSVSQSYNFFFYTFSTIKLVSSDKAVSPHKRFNEKAQFSVCDSNNSEHKMVWQPQFLHNCRNCHSSKSYILFEASCEKSLLVCHQRRRVSVPDDNRLSGIV